MIHNPKKYQSMPLGIVVRQSPGVTAWEKWVWRAVAVLPGAGPAHWRVMRKEGEITEYHAATPVLELHGADTESYLHGLSAHEPCVYVVLRPSEGENPLDVLLATVSPYEAQDYSDGGEEIVEKVPMPASLMAWVEEFVAKFHEDEVFKKRQRDRTDIGLTEDGIGDARIPQMADVYRAPSQARKERLH